MLHRQRQAASAEPPIACGRGEEPWLEKRWCCDGSGPPRKRRGSGMDPRHSAGASLPTRPRMTDFICRRRQLSAAVPGMLTDGACSRTAASGGIIEVAPTGIGTSPAGPIGDRSLGGKAHQRRRLAGAPPPLRHPRPRSDRREWRVSGIHSGTTKKMSARLRARSDQLTQQPQPANSRLPFQQMSPPRVRGT